MGFWDYLGIKFKFGPSETEKQLVEIKELLKQTPKKTVEEIEIELPTKSERSSSPDNVNLLNLIYQDLAQVNPDFSIELLKALENLGMYNADVSKAIENIVNLGNTELKIEFGDDVPDELAKECRTHLFMKSRRWYMHSEGLNSLTNDLFAQVALTGVVSGEIIPNEALDGVKKAVLVTPKNIRFVYSAKEDRFMPHQSVNGKFNLDNVAGLIPLNEITYKYMALRRFNENPYGIPPFLAALEGISIERTMMCNFSNITKKLGALGFLQVLINKPVKLQNETDAAYQARALTYLNSLSPEVQKSMGSGFVMGFKDTHEFKLDPGASANAEGASTLFDLNNQSKMSGLKQDPLMFGRQFNTSETLGRVILLLMTNQVGNYQKTVAAFLREMFLMELLLAGFPISNLEVCFEKPMMGDQSKEQEAWGKKIDNYKKLRDEGIISQTQFANALGYEKPDSEEPVYPNGVVQVEPVDDPAGSKGTDPSKNLKDEIVSYETEFNIFMPEFDYCSDVQCGCDRVALTRQLGRFDQNDGYERYAALYVGATREQYRKAVDKASRAIAAALTHMGQGSTLEQVTDKIFYTLYKHWKSNFTEPQKKIIKKRVKEAYVYFRQSVQPFANAPNIPAATFGLIDTRTMEYYMGSDELYLGKFITDRDTKKALTAFIKEEYIGKNLPLGSAEGLALFKEKFGKLFQGEEWKLDRIISTTVNTLRNSAAIAYMNQAEVEEYEIVGVNDRLQCAYCASMQGKRFSVAKSFESVNQFVKGDPNAVKYEKPFVTSVFKSADEMKDLTGEQLQARGIHLPSYHPGCRDTVVAVLD